MVQPLYSALHTLCGHLEPPPTSDQGLGGASRHKYSTRPWERGVATPEHELAASERAGEAEQVRGREQTSSGTPPSTAGSWSCADPEQGQSAIFFLNNTDNTHCNELQHHK